MSIDSFALPLTWPKDTSNFLARSTTSSTVSLIIKGLVALHLTWPKDTSNPQARFTNFSTMFANQQGPHTCPSPAQAESPSTLINNVDVTVAIHYCSQVAYVSVIWNTVPCFLLFLCRVLKEQGKHLVLKVKWFVSLPGKYLSALHLTKHAWWNLEVSHTSGMLWICSVHVRSV